MFNHKSPVDRGLLTAGILQLTKEAGLLEEYLSSSQAERVFAYPFSGTRLRVRLHTTIMKPTNSVYYDEPCPIRVSLVYRAEPRKTRSSWDVTLRQKDISRTGDIAVILIHVQTMFHDFVDYIPKMEKCTRCNDAPIRMVDFGQNYLSDCANSCEEL